MAQAVRERFLVGEELASSVMLGERPLPACRLAGAKGETVSSVAQLNDDEGSARDGGGGGSVLL